MARVVRPVKLTPEFLAHRAACGVLRPSSATALLGKAIAELGQALALPEPGDSMTLLEPDSSRGVSIMVCVRRVRGLNLWIWYRDAGALVELVALTNHPPEPRP